MTAFKETLSSNPGCGDCDHLIDLSQRIEGLGVFPSCYYGECNMSSSDHYGHVVAFSHEACKNFWDGVHAPVNDE
jgi:hypothetical protein